MWGSTFVGEGRFELPTACSQSTCATWLRHSPLVAKVTRRASGAHAAPPGDRRGGASGRVLRIRHPQSVFAPPASVPLLTHHHA